MKQNKPIKELFQGIDISKINEQYAENYFRERNIDIKKEISILRKKVFSIKCKYDKENTTSNQNKLK